MSKPNVFFTFLFFILIVGLIVLLILLYKWEIRKEINLQGLWTSNDCGFNGEWVHIRIDGISYERALEICAHEVGHEMFAEKCETNPKLCFDLIKELEERK